MRRFLAILLVVLAIPIAGRTESADQDPLSQISQLAWRLVGDRFVWGDVKVRSGWRVQENGITGRCRILDPDEATQIEGDCSSTLESFAKFAPAPKATSSPLVVLVHGLGGARIDFSTLLRDLRRSGIAAETVAYPSTLGGIASHAHRINAVLNGLGGRQPVVFVTHSMGALVVRTALAEAAAWRSDHTVLGLVMIGPPNRGAALARTASDFAALLGPATFDLTPEKANLIPLPTVRYCVIAGGLGDGKGYNPAIPGDDDGIVGVEETRLQGAEDRLVLRAGHRELLAHPETLAAVRRFISGGRCGPS